MGVILLIHSKFRRRLLGSSALVAGAFFMATSGAQAVPSYPCDGGPVADGVTITCSGGINEGVVGDGDNVTVTLNSGAEMSIADGRGLDLEGDHNTVNFVSHSYMYASDTGKTANFDGSN